MNVFELRDRIVNDYGRYTRSFIKINDERIRNYVESSLDEGAFWPEPLLQLNPNFEHGGIIDELVSDKTLHSECSKIFRIDKSDTDHFGKPLLLHFHQREAILKAKENKSYVLTSGTGSGKSLTYIIPIVDHILRHGTGRGIQAIVVYPMNALANSQEEELIKFLHKGYPEGESPVRFALYTGQQKANELENIRNNPPDIILTNYMMLELLLTRIEDRALVRAAQGVRFLVFDEMHTYRGRQGADVALLIRRCRFAFGSQDIIHVGTSATMASDGNSFEQKKTVASVAQTLFGVPFDTSQVIGETLKRATPEIDLEDNAVIESIKITVKKGINPPENFEEFHSHPLASWVESIFGIKTEESTGRLVRQTPRKILGKGSVVDELSQLTATEPGKCLEVLKSYLLKGAVLRSNQSSRFPIFAFRLHQFFSRGDSVWATMESEEVRHLEITKKGSKPGEPDKPLYPLVFCRLCGTAYYRAKEVSINNQKALLPREDQREIEDDGSSDVYVYISSSSPWPREVGPALLERIPSYMVETTSRGVERVKSEYRKDLPEFIFINSNGHFVSEDHGICGALIRKNFLFCLNPACRIAYGKRQRSEKPKLSTLGIDNRSTATTILAIRSLIELQGNRDLNPEARKLLSFTDNRQDASLQAGHFNDFAQIAMLRSALHKAARGKTEGLNHGDLSRDVFNALQLQFEEYAADPEVRGPAKISTDDAFRKTIEYFLYRDLRRGWRVTAPNLEDCGLLLFNYEGLLGNDSLLSDESLWTKGFSVSKGRGESEFIETPDSLRFCSLEKKEEVLRTLLDVLRRSLAIKVEVLDLQKQRDWIERTKNRLLEGTVWYLEDTRELVQSTVAYPRSKKRQDRDGVYISSYGSFGFYLKRSLQSAEQSLSRQDVDEVIRFLFLALKCYGIVEQVRSGEVPGYQINADALRWLPGTGEVRPIDRMRMQESGEIPPEANRYFVDCYRNFVELKCVLEAREHTAQVASEDREDREERFRFGKLPLLFCSPTMELGVDVAQLNLVNLRNVPPSPANYAQRSGRAGRGGQPALVFTYFAGRSPHDQYYFREPNKIVSGSVTAPRIDIRNHDLIRSHIHAIWMEVARPNLGKTLATILDLSPGSGELPLPVKDSLRDELKNPSHRGSAAEKSDRLIGSIRDELSSANWFHENWTKEVLDQIERSFDTACVRWRGLYRSAIRQRELHHRIIGDPGRPEYERNQSRRLRAQAESQIRLLTEAQGIFEGDFYSCRYLAAEGFLPGYNFPRLPLSAFVPGRHRRSSRDEFISRPRFLAIEEFGPQALVYHEGARYQVYKVNLDFGSNEIESTHDLATSTIKRCPDCGYAHFEQGSGFSEVCDRCGNALDDSIRFDNLIHLQNVTLKLAQRITCDEEERRRFGYKILTSYRFPEIGGRRDRKDANVYCDQTLVMRISYGDATDLYRINLGWANQSRGQPNGFNLNLERGDWAKNPVDGDDPATPGRIQRVVPFVRDTKNSLVVKVEPVRPNAELASLQAALKEAIQKYFQLEPRELSCEPMPSSTERKEILFYESSEGGAGVLRQIAEDPNILPLLARLSLEICHFDPDSLEDKAEHTCGKACYECLLDYGNQTDHKELDRKLIRDLLADLARSVSKTAGGAGSREERLVELKNRCDSQLEKKWLDKIDKLQLRLPSDAQYLISSCSTRPDFFYSEYNAAIYVDGPPHDTPEQIRNDEEITRKLMDAGYIVLRFHHEDDWDEIFGRHPDIFGVLQG